MFLTLPLYNTKLLDNHFLCHRSLQGEINHKPYSFRTVLKINAADQQICLKSMTTFLLILFNQFYIRNGSNCYFTTHYATSIMLVLLAS